MVGRFEGLRHGPELALFDDGEEFDSGSLGPGAAGYFFDGDFTGRGLIDGK